MSAAFRRMAGIILPPLVLFVLFLVGWHWAVKLLEVKPFVVPLPGAVLEAAKDNWPALSQGFLLTGKAAVLGFLSSLIVGMLIAFIFSQSLLIQRAAYPYAIFLQTVPVVAVAPLIIMWFGNDMRSIVITSFIISIFPIITNTTTGLTTLNRNMVELFDLNNASRLQKLLKLQLPNSVPYIVAGAKISSGLSVIGAIIGEFFAGFGGDKFGLGYLVYMANNQFKTSYVFAAVIASTILGLVLFAVISLLGSLLTLRWREPEN